MKLLDAVNAMRPQADPERYEVLVSCDSSGAQYIGGALVHDETHDLGAAKREARRLTAEGRCGRVRRRDGAELWPDLSAAWIGPDGNEVPA